MFVVCDAIKNICEDFSITTYYKYMKKKGYISNRCLKELMAVWHFSNLRGKAAMVVVR